MTDTKAPEKGLVCHSVTIEEGVIAEGDTVRAVVDETRRARISRNHTCTHLLHAALRQVLGEHVNQAAPTSALSACASTSRISKA